MRIYRNLRFSRPLFLLPAAVGALVLGGCATAPLGPTIAVMPAPGMPFEQFQAIDASCRQFAQQQAAPYQGGASNSIRYAKKAESAAFQSPVKVPMTRLEPDIPARLFRLPWGWR